MIAWLISRIYGDKSLKALLRMRAEIRDLERENDKLRQRLKDRSEAMKQIVRSAKEHCDDICFY